MLPERLGATSHGPVTAGGGEGAAAWAGMPTRDRSFAFDLVTGVIRWRNLLDAVIGSRLKQPIETLDQSVRALLWMGAYQLLLQGGTTDYAAVDTTVELAKRMKSAAKAAGLINAVLRGITRLKPERVPRGSGKLDRKTFAIDFSTQVTLNTDIFPNPGAAPMSHLAVVRSHPPQYVDFLRKLFGDEKAGDLLLRNNLRPTITLRADVDVIDVPALAGLAAHATVKRFLVATEGWTPALDTLVNKGLLSPQDPTAAKPVAALAEALAKGGGSPKRLLDLCAGLGTKAIQMARAFPEAKIVASDTDPKKLARLAERAGKMGLKNILNVPATELGGHIVEQGRFDAVLVDVPCSNTGVMAKRVQSRWRWITLDHEGLHTLQKNLLIQAAAYLNPGGVLVYATCSIDPAENEKLVRGLLKEFPQDMKVVHQENTLPSLTDDPTGTHDGGYYAVLR